MRSGYSLFSLLHFPANSSQEPHKCSCALGHSALTDWPLQGVWWRRLIRGEEMVEACNIDTSISSLAKARASCMIPKNSPILPANTGSTCSSHGAGEAMATDMFSGYGAKDQDAEAMNRHRIIDLLFAVGAHTICAAHTSYAPSFECMPIPDIFPDIFPLVRPWLQGCGIDCIPHSLNPTAYTVLQIYSQRQPDSCRTLLALLTHLAPRLSSMPARSGCSRPTPETTAYPQLFSPCL